MYFGDTVTKDFFLSKLANLSKDKSSFVYNAIIATLQSPKKEKKPPVENFRQKTLTLNESILSKRR